MTIEEITDHSKYLLKTAGLDETIITHIIEKYSSDLEGLLNILQLLHGSGKLTAFCAIDNTGKTTLETVLGETPNLSRQTLALEAIQVHLKNLSKEDLIDILIHPKLKDLAIILGFLKDHMPLEEVTSLLTHQQLQELLNASDLLNMKIARNDALKDPNTIAFLRANPTALTNLNDYDAINLQTAVNDWNNLIFFLNAEVDRHNCLQKKPAIKETLRTLDINTLSKIKTSKEGTNSSEAYTLVTIFTLIESLLQLKEDRSHISKYVALAVRTEGPGHWSLYFSQVTRLLETVGPEVTGQEMIRAVLTNPNLVHLDHCLNALTELPTDTKEAALKALESIIAYRPTNNFAQASFTASELLRTYWGIIAPKLNQGADFTTIARVIHYMTREMDDNQSDALTVRLLQDPAYAALFTPAVAEALKNMQYIKSSEITSTRESILETTLTPVTIPNNSALFPIASRSGLAETIKDIIQQKMRPQPLPRDPSSVPYYLRGQGVYFRTPPKK